MRDDAEGDKIAGGNTYQSFHLPKILLIWRFFDIQF